MPIWHWSTTFANRPPHQPPASPTNAPTHDIACRVPTGQGVDGVLSQSARATAAAGGRDDQRPYRLDRNHFASRRHGVARQNDCGPLSYDDKSEWCSELHVTFHSLPLPTTLCNRYDLYPPPSHQALTTIHHPKPPMEPRIFDNDPEGALAFLKERVERFNRKVRFLVRGRIFRVKAKLAVSTALLPQPRSTNHQYQHHTP